MSDDEEDEDYRGDLPDYKKYNNVVDWLETNEKWKTLFKCMDVESVIKYSRENTQHELYLYVVHHYTMLDKKSKRIISGCEHFNPLIIIKFMRDHKIDTLTEYFHDRGLNPDQILFDSKLSINKIINAALKSRNKEFILTVNDFLRIIQYYYSHKQLKQLTKLFNLNELVILQIDEKICRREYYDPVQSKVIYLNTQSIQIQKKQLNQVRSDDFTVCLAINILSSKFVYNHTLPKLYLDDSYLNIIVNDNDTHINNVKFLKELIKKYTRFNEREVISTKGTWNNVCMLLVNDFNTKYYCKENEFGAIINKHLNRSYTLFFRHRQELITNKKIKSIIKLISLILIKITTKNMTKLINDFA